MIIERTYFQESTVWENFDIDIEDLKDWLDGDELTEESLMEYLDTWAEGEIVNEDIIDRSDFSITNSKGVIKELQNEITKEV